MALQWQTLQIPLVAGVDTKTQGQALEAPALATALDVEFDDVGGLRMRKPFADMGTSILGGGTLANVRKLFVVEDELCVFTKDTLYAWSATLSKWVSRGTHLAVATTETARFGNTSDQVFADRAQLSGVIVYAWTEVTSAGAIPYLAAIDATTGATLIAPTSFGGTTYTRPRVTALSTKILVSWVLVGTGLQVKAIDPASPSFTTAGATLLSANAAAYDIKRNDTADSAAWVVRAGVGNSYDVGIVSSAPAVTASVTKAQVADGIISISVAPAAANRITVLRTNAFLIKADLINRTTLVDVTMNTALGGGAAAITQLTGAHRSVTNGGFYRCYVFWTDTETTTPSGPIGETNWIDTNAAVGTESAFLREIGIGSHAFDYNGEIYLWMIFNKESLAIGTGTPLGLRSQLQNTYHLVRDDGTIVAKAAWCRAGGYSYQNGHLPGVATTGTTGVYAWAGTERHVIVTGGTDQSKYGARVPLDTVLTFDSDNARRVAVLGRTAYVSGGLLLQYDGEGLTEVGFEEVGCYITAGSGGGGSGLIPAGSYSYKATLRWENARGEVERSTSVIGLQQTAAALDKISLTVNNLWTTRKQSSRRAPAIEFWRTKLAPVADSPFYLVTSKDPSATGDNLYISNNPAASGSTSVPDNFTDAVLETKEQNPENGSVLPRLAPPPATILCGTDTRLFLAGVAGEPNRIHYSLLRDEQEIVGFNSALSFTLPTWTGAITGLAILNDTLIAFTATAIYAIPGDGFDNTGGGANYGPPRLISTDVGAISHDSIATTPSGLVFYSRKGWYRLSTGLAVDYIGAPAQAFSDDDGDCVAALTVESQHQVRFLTPYRVVVWDYLVNQWASWTETGGRDFVMWRGTPVLLDSAVKPQQTSFDTVSYKMQIETGWIKLNGLQGFGRVRRVGVLGDIKDAFQLELKLWRDYATLPFDTRTFQVTDLAQIQHGPSQQRVEALKVRITINDPNGGVAAFDPVTLTSIALEVGIRPGNLNRRLGYLAP